MKVSGIVQYLAGHKMTRVIERDLTTTIKEEMVFLETPWIKMLIRGKLILLLNLVRRKPQDPRFLTIAQMIMIEE